MPTEPPQGCLLFSAAGFKNLEKVLIADVPIGGKGRLGIAGLDGQHAKGSTLPDLSSRSRLINDDDVVVVAAVCSIEISRLT